MPDFWTSAIVGAALAFVYLLLKQWSRVVRAWRNRNREK